MTKEDYALLRQILCKSQSDLKEWLCCRLRQKGRKIVNADGYLYSEGSIPVLLVAHLDTVHTALPEHFVFQNGCLSAEEGIGGDDRAGVYMICKIIENADCSVLFCEDEESGGVGASKFADTGVVLPVNYIIELDRAKEEPEYDTDGNEMTVGEMYEALSKLNKHVAKSYKAKQIELFYFNDDSLASECFWDNIKTYDKQYEYPNGKFLHYQNENVITGYVGKWNGKHTIQPMVCNTLEKALRMCFNFSGSFTSSVVQTDHGIEVTLRHHDGRCQYLIRKMKQSKVDDYYENIEPNICGGCLDLDNSEIAGWLEEYTEKIEVI